MTRSFLVLALGVAFSASAQENPPSHQSLPSETGLRIADLPVVELATSARKKLYPFWSSDVLPAIPSANERGTGLSPGAILDPPAVISTIRSEMARAVSLEGEQNLQWELENDPRRWPATIQTVNMFANEERISFEPRRQNAKLERQVGTLFLKSLDPWRLAFSHEEVRQFMRDRGGLKAAVEGRDLTWIDNVVSLSRQRQRQWMANNRDTLRQHSAVNGLPEFCPLSRKWKTKPTGFIRQDRLDLHRRTAFCDDISGRISRVKPENTKELEKLFSTMASEYEELIAALDRQPAQTPYVAFLAARMAVLDPHAAYIPAHRRSDMSARINSAYVGVGVTMMYKGSTVSFASVSPDGPAFEAGIRAGDTLIAAGPTVEKMQPVEELSQVQITALLSGLEGGTVSLRIRDTNGVVSDKIVRRRRISVNDGRVKVNKIKTGDMTVLHIRVSGFYEDTFDRDRPGGSTYSDLRRALEESTDHDWVLLDLRGNGGGLLSQAVKVSGLFLPPGPVVQLESPSGQTAVMSTTEQPLWTGPLALLVDRTSASASEITAAALQDRGRAVILGETTFGKGTAQQQYDMDRLAGAPAPVYGYLNLTSLRFFRPSGQTTQLLGVVPDIAFIPELGSGRESDKDFVLRPTTLPSLLDKPQSTPWAGCYEKVSRQAIAQWNASDWAGPWSELRKVRTANPIDLSKRRAELERQRSNREQLRKAVDKLPEKDAPLSVALTSLSLLQRCTLPPEVSSTSYQDSL